MVKIREPPPPPVLLDFFFKASINDFHCESARPTVAFSELRTRGRRGVTVGVGRQFLGRRDDEADELKLLLTLSLLPLWSESGVPRTWISNTVKLSIQLLGTTGHRLIIA
jgi:hypothetical protein